MAIFTPDAGMTLQEMLAQRDLQSAQPSLSQADSPLSFQYQNEEYPNKYGKEKLYYDRLGPFSDKRQVEDPDAYYNQVRSLGNEGDPFMGIPAIPFMGYRDRYDDAPFAKQSGDYYAGDYVNYDETIDRPYQGNWEWQEGYNPDLKGQRENDPMLMEAFINQRNGLPQILGVKKNVSEPTIDYSNVMGRDLEADDGAQIVNGLKQPYTMSGQLAKDFSKDGIPKDFIDGLRLAGSELKTGIFDNPLTRGAGTALNFLRGNVPGMLMSGLGAIFNRDPNAPSYQQYSPQSYLKENNLSNIYNANPSMINDFYDDNPDSDTFNTTRFDRATTAFGKSRALFGPNGIAATKAKMAAAKAAKARAYKEKQAADAITAAANTKNRDGTTAAYNYAGRVSSGGRHDSTMSNEQAQANQDRGRGRYNQGGIASMFTRRR
jgi:hypothetical protein